VDFPKSLHAAIGGMLLEPIAIIVTDIGSAAGTDFGDCFA
jgi:hypothetical protein